MNGVLGRIKLGDKAHAEVSGPQLIFVRAANGQKDLDIGYQAVVVLEHNRLLDQDPVAVTVGVRGLLPHTQSFEQATAPLLEECRKLRDQANSPALDAGAKAAVENAAVAARSEAFAKALDSVAEDKPKSAPRERESHFK
jgi:hypothetical protein